MSAEPRNNQGTRIICNPKPIAAFEPDGALRDICILNAGEDDWNQAAEFISKSQLRFEFSGGQEGPVFPTDIASLFPFSPEVAQTMLSVDVSGVKANCHFFDQNEIKFDIDPAEVTSQARAEAVFGFMVGLARAVGKPVSLTLENCPDEIFRQYDPSDTIDTLQTFGS